MLETNVMGCAMTTLNYVSHMRFQTDAYQFKIHDRFSACMTCLRYYPCVRCQRAISMRLLSLFRTLRILTFLSLREEYVFEEMLVRMTVWSSKKVSLSRNVILSKNGSSGVCDVSCFTILQGFSINPASDVRSQNLSSCLDVKDFDL
ncbi:hypothetical protein IGI04_030285 [Brassica rapa subsp. trilocularis]|uniref:Uncharacterized protein n=1 Tax=Brassica rapa subsp. trilocularis TaxID=1813537 RepID=A0ABQ7LQ93_BRACM|nr:hypothetical protein IGI04_030285 [Brassica rapa subsp. trilocularis]